MNQQDQRYVRTADTSRSSFPLGKAFKCASEGIGYTFSSQRNLKIQCCFAVLAVVLGIVFGITPTQWAVICVCIVLVMGGECINTAIESVVDLVSPEWNILAKRAKDCAAGAVWIFAIGSVVVALFIFLPPFLALFSA